jgi:hypothetical protein
MSTDPTTKGSTCQQPNYSGYYLTCHRSNYKKLYMSTDPTTKGSTCQQPNYRGYYFHVSVAQPQRTELQRSLDPPKVRWLDHLFQLLLGFTCCPAPCKHSSKAHRLRYSSCHGSNAGCTCFFISLNAQQRTPNK